MRAAPGHEGAPGRALDALRATDPRRCSCGTATTGTHQQGIAVRQNGDVVKIEMVRCPRRGCERRWVLAHWIGEAGTAWECVGREAYPGGVADPLGVVLEAMAMIPATEHGSLRASWTACGRMWSRTA